MCFLPVLCQLAFVYVCTSVILLLHWISHAPNPVLPFGFCLCLFQVLSALITGCSPVEQTVLYLSEVVNSHVISHTFQFCVVTTGMLVR